jgi:hypothetical protein
MNSEALVLKQHLESHNAVLSKRIDKDLHSSSISSMHTNLHEHSKQQRADAKSLGAAVASQQTMDAKSNNDDIPDLAPVTEDADEVSDEVIDYGATKNQKQKHISDTEAVHHKQVVIDYGALKNQNIKNNNKKKQAQKSADVPEELDRVEEGIFINLFNYLIYFILKSIYDGTVLLFL